MTLSLSAQVQNVFLALLAVLLVATTIGRWLKFRQGTSVTATIENLNARIDAWWLMCLTILLAVWLGRIGTIVLFAIISLFALREFLALVDSRRSDYGALVICFYFILPVQYWFVATDWYGMFSIFVPVYGFLLLPIMASLGGETTRFLERTAKIQWAVMISIFCISHIPALINLKIPGFDDNILLVIFLIIVVQGSDVLQYVWGKLLGKKKISPSLSPSKTLAGTVGGIISSSLLAMALHGITPFNFWQAGLIGCMISIMGFLGGLVMSAIKRDRNIKDWGQLIRGHGGMLDRMDSLCFSAPIFFHILRYGWQP